MKLIFHRVEFLFSIVFGGFSWLELADSRDFIIIRLNIETNSPLKPTKGCFIFIGSDTLSQANGSKKLRFEPKL